MKKPNIEVFDNSKYEEKWLNCDFDDSKWENASVKTDELTLRTEKDSLSFNEEEPYEDDDTFHDTCNADTPPNSD